MFSRTAINLRKARRFMSNVVNPHPIAEFPISRRCRYCGYTGTTTHHPNCASLVSSIKSSASYSHQGATVETMKLLYEQVESTPERGQPGVYQDITPRYSSVRLDAEKSVARSALYLEERRRDLAFAIEQPDFAPFHRLRRTSRRISRMSDDPMMPGSYYLGDSLDDHPLWLARGSFGESQSEILCASSIGDGSSFISQYATARSDFTEPSEPEDPTPILRVMDSDTGAIFERVLQGDLGEVPPADVVLDNGGENLRCVVPPAQLGTLSGDLGWLGTLVAPVPALVLTLPTPRPPPSPIFVLQSPITVPKFLAAASAVVDDPEQMSPLLQLPVPALPMCDQCSPDEFEEAALCRACSQQWLACKIWYQANDSGRKQLLTEPYIKPAESNASNRMVADLLATPTDLSGSCGLGIDTVLPGSLVQTRFKRLAMEFVRAIQRSPVSRNGRGEVDEQTGRLFGEVVPRVASAVLKRVWTRGKKALLSPIRRISPVLGALLNPVSRGILSCDLSISSSFESAFSSPLRPDQFFLN